MSTLIGLFIPILGLLIYFKKPHLLFIYWMVTWPLLCPIFCFLGGMNDVERTNDFLYKVSGNFAYLYVFIVLFLFGKRFRRVTAAQKLMLSLGLICCFFVIHPIITNFSAQRMYLNIKGAVYILLPMFVMMMDEKTRPRIRQMYKVAVFILFLQTVFVYLNFLGVRTYVAWYQSVLEYPEFANLSSGTFMGSARFSDFIATLFMFLCVDFFARREIPTWQFCIISALCAICLLTAGSRMPIALSVIVFCLTVFFYGKEYKMLLIIMLLIAYGGLAWLGNYKGGELTENDGVNRIVDGLTSFTQSKKYGDDDDSTVRLSEKLLEGYFYRAPLFGNGRVCLGENAYPIADKVSDTTDFNADAHLAFMLVEYGIVGVGLYFLLFFNIFKYFRQRLSKAIRKSVVVIFVFYVILSITEAGLWDLNLFPYVYMYFFAMIAEQIPIQNNRENKVANNETNRSIVNGTQPQG